MRGVFVIPRLPPYPKKTVRKLASKWGISEFAQLRSFWKFLRTARLIYEYKKAEPADNVSARPVRSLLKSLETKATTLVALLDKLDPDSPDPAVRRVVRILGSYESEARRLAMDSDALESAYGHHFSRIETSPGTQAIFWLDYDKILNSLRILAAYARSGLQRTERGRHGPPRNEALYSWVVNMEGYWTKTLRKRFTLQVYEGMPKSQAFIFCREALHAIDPSVKDVALGGAMRKLIKVRGQQRKTRKKPA
jgi:hypothetical protein